MNVDKNPSFLLTNQQLLRLSKLSQDLPFNAKIENKFFSFNLEQIFFLSITLYQYFLTKKRIFVISVEDFQGTKSLNSFHLITCFSQIYSLFFQHPQMEFDATDQPYIEFLANILHNRSLLQLSNQLAFSQKVLFSFNSIQFSYISQEFRNKIKNFSLIINDVSYEVNSSFLSCLSDRIFYISKNDPTLQTLNLGKKPQDYIKLFQGVLTIFDGEPFPVHQIIQSNQFFQSLLEICSDLQIQELHSKLLEFLPIPNCIGLSLQFFQRFWFNLSSDHLNAAIK
jgi:hypothetical protein